MSNCGVSVALAPRARKITFPAVGASVTLNAISKAKFPLAAELCRFEMMTMSFDKVALLGMDILNQHETVKPLFTPPLNALLESPPLALFARLEPLNVAARDENGRNVTTQAINAQRIWANRVFMGNDHTGENDRRW